MGTAVEHIRISHWQLLAITRSPYTISLNVHQRLTNEHESDIANGEPAQQGSEHT
jgi:hypothetical protein